MTIPFSSCNTSKGDNAGVIIGKPVIEVKDGRMSPEILHSLGQVNDVVVSPDKQTILYGVSYTDIALNKRNRELFTVHVDGTNKRQITHSPESELNAQWVKGGEKIAFLYGGQIWEMNPDGTDRVQISQYERAIEGFQFSPDGRKILFISQVKSFEPSSEIYKDLDKTSGRIINDLMYKHWDEWMKTVPHPFLADYDGKSLSNVIDVLEGEPFEAPMRPFGGIEELTWSPDSESIAYSSKKKVGKAYTQSTNSDIYIYTIKTKETKNVTEGMMGYDTRLQFSPDGRSLAWLSMERDGYESDKNRLFVMNVATGEKIYITENFDYNVDFFRWNSNHTICFISTVEAKTQIFSTNTECEIIPITSGEHDYKSFDLAVDKLIAIRHSMSKPNEIYSVDIHTGDAVELSFENKETLDQIKMGQVEERWINTTDGKKMLTWIIYPPDFDPAKKYPALLYCQGGPQITVSQIWSTRWNFQLMAANGYIVVAPNRRGLPGFGQEWLEQISGDYGGQNMKDYLSAIDELAKESFVDASKLGCTGASYGGFSVFWLAGNHEKRFKAFFAHAGIFDMEAQYLETEEMWFADWDLGGPYWDKSNKVAQNSYANSPHLFVEKWDTPIMISHGELDYRILASQGMMAFNAAQLRHIPSRLLIFPDENHWISQPQNGILFQREFFRWFDAYLKN